MSDAILLNTVVLLAFLMCIKNIKIYMYALICVFLFVSLAAWDRIRERFSNFLSVDDYESINGCLFLYKTLYKIHSSVCLFVCLFPSFAFLRCYFRFLRCLLHRRVRAFFVRVFV